jgi:hypothetical protein
MACIKGRLFSNRNLSCFTPRANDHKVGRIALTFLDKGGHFAVTETAAPSSQPA